MFGLVIFGILSVLGCLSLGSLVWFTYLEDRGYNQIAKLLGEELEEEVNRAKTND